MRHHYRSLWQNIGYYSVVLMQVFMASVGTWLLLVKDWKYASIALASFAFGFALLIMNRLSKRITIPVGFMVLYVGFIFLSFFLGEVFGFYGKIAMWDMSLHFASGVLLALAGFWWMRELKKYHAVKAPLWLALFFAFCVSVTGGALWESVEFLSDEWFGTFSQDGGLADTMHDIVANALASLLTVVAIALYKKQQPQSLLQRLLRRPPTL